MQAAFRNRQKRRAELSGQLSFYRAKYEQASTGDLKKIKLDLSNNFAKLIWRSDVTNQTVSTADEFAAQMVAGELTESAGSFEYFMNIYAQSAGNFGRIMKKLSAAPCASRVPLRWRAGIGSKSVTDGAQFADKMIGGELAECAGDEEYFVRKYEQLSGDLQLFAAEMQRGGAGI